MKLLRLFLIIVPCLMFSIEPFVLLTIPKSGSHLMIKTLHFMTGGVPIWHTSFPSLHYIQPEEGFLYTHLCTSPQLEDDYNQLPRLRKIVNIRDLRDVAVSIVNHIKKAPWPGLTHREREAFLGLTFDRQLMFVINYDYDLKKIAKKAPNNLQVSLKQVASQAIQYCNNPHNLITRYENLVGPHGGGTEEDQRLEILKIANFIGFDISEDQLVALSLELYGNENDPFGKDKLHKFKSTFHKGQVGNWRYHFKEEHKELFKEKFGEDLIILGYENDLNW